VRRNSFTEDEVVLCAFAALHDENEFGGIGGVHRQTNHCTSSIRIKIRNNAAVLEQDGLPQNQRITRLMVRLRGKAVDEPIRKQYILSLGYRAQN
jgi:hypothetical protein